MNLDLHPSSKTVSRREKPFFFASIFGGSPLLLQQVFATPPPPLLAGREAWRQCVREQGIALKIRHAWYCHTTTVLLQIDKLSSQSHSAH